MGIKLTKVDPFTGLQNTLELDITAKDYVAYLRSSDSIQDVFPHLSDDEREFILTGTIPNSWDEMFGEED